MCKHQYEYAGHRSFGDDIPGYAQGAYFPGDEPGTRCRLTGEACGNVCGDASQDCAAITRTEWPCPVCAADGWGTSLLHDERDDTYLCPACDKRYTFHSLPDAYCREFGGLLADYNALLDERRKLEAEEKRLRGLVETISAAINAAKQEAAD